MSTGYMGADEPTIIPVGDPEQNKPTEETFTNLSPKKEEAPADAEKVTEVAKPVDDKPTDTKVVEGATEVVKPTETVIEKIVEKIVEKHPEFKDEDSKALYERFVNGDQDGIYNYLSERRKDYDTMSDIDVVKAGLALKNPQWTKQDIELELRAEYGKQLEKYNMDDFDKEVDPEAYKEALAHNDKADENLFRLQRAARDNRVILKERQKTIELPKIAKDETPAVNVPTAPTQDEIDESRRVWAENAVKQVPALADFKFNVGDGINNEDVTYAITDEDKSARVEAMKIWNGRDFMANRGWTNEDGSFNLLKIAEDVHYLENKDNIAKSIYTQATKKATKNVVKEIKNIDDEKTRNAVTAVVAGDVDGGYWN